MKKIYKSALFYGIIGAVALSATSCMDKYDNLNPWEVVGDAPEKGDTESSNKEDASDEVIEGELMSAMSLVINYNTHKYQYQRTNSIDVFAGYGTVSKSVFEFGGALMHSYYYPNGYITGAMGESKRLYPQLYRAYTYAEAHNRMEWKAISQILYAYSLQELVDFFGAIPYKDFRSLKEELPLEYLSGAETYDLIFADLDEAVETLKKVQPSAALLEKVEGTLGGYSNLNWQNWVKFANSIRLRMAMNIVKVNPSLAQQMAEKAVADGVLDDDFGYPIVATAEHPLYGISYVWNDYRLGASLENILKRYRQGEEGQLISKWFEKNNAAVKTSQGALTLSGNKDYIGMRQGVDVDPSPATNGYGAFSRFNNKSMPRNYFKLTEILFLRAEGALRGWAMNGTAEDLYKQGIQRLFTENGLTNYDEYINQETAADVQYLDYYKPEFSVTEDWRGVHVGVKWNEADSKEVKLEKIITQKYIAVFPMSAEAWTTYRRTGYPRLFPVPEKNAWSYDTSVDYELQIRRLPYDETTANDRVNIPSIETALGAKNQAGTRVWWDVDLGDTRDEHGQIVPKNF